MRRLLPVLVLTVMLGCPLYSTAGTPMGDETVAKLIETIKANDVEGFRAALAPDFASDMTPRAVAAFMEPIAPRLLAGYSLEKMGTLKQDDMSVDVYKLTMRDGGDDLLLRTVLDGGKIAGLLVTAPFQ